MKAKYFKQLRTQVQYYDVRLTGGLFGDFFWYCQDFKPVLARDHYEAAKRIKKRYGLSESIESGRTEQWARYRVKLSDKPNHHRHYEYF